MRGIYDVGKLRHCSRCNSELPRHAFYAKGSRLDSACRECKKDMSRATYQAKKDRDSFNNLLKFVNLMCELECCRVDRECTYLDQIIRRHNANCQ